MTLIQLGESVSDGAGVVSGIGVVSLIWHLRISEESVLSETLTKSSPSVQTQWTWWSSAWYCLDHFSLASVLCDLFWDVLNVNIRSELLTENCILAGIRHMSIFAWTGRPITKDMDMLYGEVRGFDVLHEDIHTMLSAVQPITTIQLSKSCFILSMSSE